MTTKEIALIRKQRGGIKLRRVCDWCKHEHVVSKELHHTSMCKKLDIAIISQDMAKNCDHFSPRK